MNGGRRPGAGRPKGSPNKRKKKIALEAAERGITPIEVMLEIMKKHYEAGRMAEALDAAAKAAPYCHPKLQAIQHTGKDGGPILTSAADMTDEQLAAIIAGASRPG